MIQGDTKSKPLPSANEIIFLGQVKETIKRYNIKYSLRDLDSGLLFGHSIDVYAEDSSFKQCIAL